MIIICAGMEKSGTGLLFNYLNDYLTIEYDKNTKTIRDKYDLNDLLMKNNCQIHNLHLSKVWQLRKTYLNEKLFVIKCHNKPEWNTKLMARLGIFKLVYSYRDPRDVILSAIDFGNKLLTQKQHRGMFSEKFPNVDIGVNSIKPWLHIWEKWNNFKDVKMIRYEDMNSNPYSTFLNTITYLGLSVNELTINKIIEKYSKHVLTSDVAAVHFNKARNQRYLTEMSDKQIELCNKELGSYIIKMGYKL